jgi:hypothetical protein
MNHATFAQALRQRQYALGQVPATQIAALDDAAIIEAYITCSCCGTQQVTPEQLRAAIWVATDVESLALQPHLTENLL